MATRTLDVQEAKTQLSRLLRAVEAGEEVLIQRAGRVVARLVRVEESGERDWSCFEGQGRVDRDAFEPMSVEEEAIWYGPIDPDR